MKRKFSILLLFVFLTGGLLSEKSEASFTPRTYDICSDIVYSYKVNQLADYNRIQQKLEELKKEDSALGDTWAELMDYWIYVNTDISIHPDILPDGLPQDDSLCIVVLGYQLLPDGTMTNQLLGRCQTALACAEKYPNAFVAVTGGGTAKQNLSVTEADSMATWLIEHGVKKERIIVENQSQTTRENAHFTCDILHENYPQITDLAIVSSDYHIPQGCLLFRAYELLSSYEYGTPALRIISNAGFMTGADEEAETVMQQGFEIWCTAGMLEK